MSSATTVRGYDYLITDTLGTRKVINGVEYPLTEVELIEYRKEHKDSGCIECSFISDVDALFIYHVSREQKTMAGFDPVFIGTYTMAKWKGHSEFYLFRCSVCDEAVVDYPHGYNGRLNCGKCGSGDVARVPNTIPN